MTYIRGWFFIDLLSIMPFDILMKLTSESGEGSGKVSGIVRITKISKLYKLVKITRLIRLIKILKNKKKIAKKMKDVV